MVSHPGMQLVSPLLKLALYPALHHSGLLNRITPPSGYAVVNYHGVVPSDHSTDEMLDGNLVQPEALRQQLQFLKSHYHVLHPDDFRAWIEQDKYEQGKHEQDKHEQGKHEQGKQLPPRSVLITCDDGLLNTLTDMLPILQSEGVSCLFLVTAASCSNEPGMLWYEELYRLMRAKPLTPDLDLLEETTPSSFQSRWWSTVRSASRLDAQTRTDWMRQVRNHSGPTQSLHSERRWRLLNISELKQLADAGMIIGAHTVSHPVLSLCTEEEARREIQESKINLERALGRRIWAFAYPFGNPSAMGERELHLAREAGFACALLNVEHWGAERSNPFAIPRTHVTSHTTLPEFAAHLSGLHARLQRAVGG
jgi:peptidoglycan/xylan/chitin deacetylase (PgdA/CDA1 family)